MNSEELANSLFEENEYRPFDIKKWTFSVMFPGVDEAFGKFTSVPREERENYFKANNSFPNLHVLCNLLVPLDVYVFDVNGKKGKIPTGILDDEFVIDASNESEFFSALVYWPQINHLRDKFYSLSKSVLRLDLSEEDMRYVFFVCLCGLLQARIMSYRSFKETCRVSDIDLNAADIDVDFLRMFIDFDKLNRDEILEIYEQAYFFRNCLTMPSWQELYGALDKSIDFTRKWVIESVTGELIKSADDKRMQIVETVFKIDSAIDIHIFDDRTRDVKFLQLERSLLQKAKETITEIAQISQQDFQNMNKSINFNAPIGQVFVDSTIRDSVLAVTMPSDMETVSGIRTGLEELLLAVKEQKEAHEIFTETIKEIATFESSSSKEVQVASAKKVVSWFQRLKDLKDSVAISFLTVDAADKFPKLLAQGEAFFKALI